MTVLISCPPISFPVKKLSVKNITHFSFENTVKALVKELGGLRTNWQQVPILKPHIKATCLAK